MAKIAYKRVSTKIQNIDRQLEKETFDKIFVEKVSVKDSNRPKLQAMLDYVRSGDEIHVHDISRLARSLIDLSDIVKSIIEKNASITFHKENLTFSAEKNEPMDKLLFQLLGCFAEFERNVILERQREGIAIAKAKGVYKGRQSKFNPKQLKEFCALWEQSKTLGFSKEKIAKQYGISRNYGYKIYNNKH